jgi:hypothetical protein
MTRQETLEQLKEKFSLTETEAEKYMLLFTRKLDTCCQAMRQE